MLVQRLVQSRHPYVTARGNVFWFRFALPRHVRQLCPQLPREIKRTLRTDSFPEALYLVNQKTDLIRCLKRSRCKLTLERLYARLRDFSEGYEALATTWEVTQPQGVSGGPSQPPAGIIEKAQSEPAAKLSEAWKGFADWRRWREKVRRENTGMMDNLSFFIGDKPVREITRKDVKTALESISRLPQRNRKLYRGKPLKELVKARIPDEHRISSKTVKEHLKLCQSFFSSYLVKELALLDRSPADGLKIDFTDHRFACLGDAQVRSILEKSKDKPEWVQWFMSLAVYSGARRSELAGLTPQDFKRCPDTGRDYFVIHRGKTKAARRMVPLHRGLVDSGLLHWVSQQDGLLFPTASANPNRVTDHFVSLVDSRVNDLGERIVFHSLRHTFITKARAAGASTVLVQQVVGHEKSGAGVTDRYTHVFPLRDVLEVVDSITYEAW